MADSMLVRGGPPAWTWPIKGGFVHTKHDPRHVLSTIAEAEADVIAVMGYSDGMTNQEADAMSLLTLLTLDRARDEGELGSERIVAHMFDSELAPLARAHAQGDFVITDALASRMLVHTSRDRHMSAVYAELFDAEGPIIDMVELDPGIVSYGSIEVGLAADQAIPIGVIVDGVVTLNPPKSSRIEFGPDDRVLVVRRARRRDMTAVAERA